MAGGSRLPAALLLGLVLVAAIVLLAGYGVFVATGLIVGLILGLIAFAAAFALQGRSGGGQSSVWITRSGRGQREPDTALIERHSGAAMRVAGVDDSALQRVIALGLTAEASGARLELIAVELRADGGIASLVAHTSPPSGFVGHFAEVTVSDDAGTVYAASGQGAGGSSPRASRLEIRFSPAPPINATMLTIQIARFADPFPHGPAELIGPWEFRVEL